MDDKSKYDLIYWNYNLSTEYITWTYIHNPPYFDDLNLFTDPKPTQTEIYSVPKYLLNEFKNNKHHKNLENNNYDEYTDSIIELPVGNKYFYGLIDNGTDTKIINNENDFIKIKDINTIKKIFVNSLYLWEYIINKYSDNKEIFEIPNNIEFIQFHHSFDDDKIILPDKLKVLKFGSKFNKIIYYPSNIYYLEYGRLFNKPVDNLPSSLEFLIFGDSFNQSLDYLGSCLKFLSIGVSFSNTLDNLPNSLESLFLTNYHSHKLNNLPFGLKELINFKDNYIFRNITIKEILKISTNNDYINKRKLYLRYDLDEKILTLNVKMLDLEYLPPNINYLYLGNNIKHNISVVPIGLKYLKLGYNDYLSPNLLYNLPKLNILILNKKYLDEIFNFSKFNSNNLQKIFLVLMIIKKNNIIKYKKFEIVNYSINNYLRSKLSYGKNIIIKKQNNRL